MEEPTAEDPVTLLLKRWSRGDREAEAEVLPLLYEELKKIAASQFRRERGEHTLQATALVHEAYLRLSDQRGLEWRHRSQFYALAAHLMRRVLVDHARGRNRAKRGSGEHRVTLSEAADVAASRQTSWRSTRRSPAWRGSIPGRAPSSSCATSAA